MNKFHDVQVKSGGLGNKSECVSPLIREKYKQSEVQFINQMIQAGRDSGTSEKTPAEILAGAKLAIEKAQQ